MPDVIEGWTPRERPASEVPILRDNRPFQVYEAERQKALSEVHAATTDETRLEAQAIFTRLYQRQTSIVGDLAGEVADLPDDEDAAKFWSWTQVWMYSARAELEDRGAEQNALLARMDEEP